MRSIKLLFFLLLSLSALGQRRPKGQVTQCDSLVKKGAYAEAVRCIRPFHNVNPTSQAYDKLLDVLLLAEDSVAAWKLVRKQSNQFGDVRPQYTVDYWYLSNLIGRSGPEFEDIITLVGSNPFNARSVAQSLENYGALSEAAAVYEAAERAQPSLRIAFEKAQVYAQLGDRDKQYQGYLQAIQQNGQMYRVVKQRITQNLSEDENDPHNVALKKALFNAIKASNNPTYEELLLFTYRQEGAYERALDYLKARAKRGDFRAGEFRQIGNACVEVGRLELASEVYEYMINKAERDDYNPWLSTVLVDLLQVYSAQGKENQALTLADEWGDGRCEPCFHWELERGVFLHRRTDSDSLDLEKFSGQMSSLRGHYPSDLEKGMTYFREAQEWVYGGFYDKALLIFARAEVLLGDSDEADQARLGRALCAFYSGDIPWAKTQLEILLQSTSKTIANDALEYALLISANSVEDTAMEGLMLIREPMLLEARGLYSESLEAYVKLERILLANEVYDDVLLRKGKIQLELGLFDDAAATFTALRGAAGEGMWKEEALYYYALARYKGSDERARLALEDYLLAYPTGLYTEDARRFYRTFAP